MINIIAHIEPFDAMLLVSSGFIALLGSFCSYRYKSGVLFSIMCIAIGVQTIMTSPVILYVNTESTAYMYFIMLAIYGIAAIIYSVIGSKFMLITSMIISAYLFYTMANALDGIEIANYVQILNILWLTQLIGGLSGVLDGYGLLNGFRRVISNLRSHITNYHHKGV